MLKHLLYPPTPTWSTAAHSPALRTQLACSRVRPPQHGCALAARAPPPPDATHTHTHTLVAPLGLWARFTKSQDFCGVGTGGSWNFLHVTKCLPWNSLLLIFDVILQQDFCTKMVMVLGWGEKGSTYFAKRYICSTFYTKKYKQSFFKAFRCWLGVGYIKSL